MLRSLRAVAPSTGNLRALQLRNVLRQRRLVSSSTDKQSRFDRVNAQLPGWLSKYTLALRDAPVTHISAFLILHELTAVVPLISLAAIFHYTNWLPPFISEWKWVSEGMVKFGNYFRRKGWIDAQDDPSKPKRFRDRWWGRSEKGTRLVVEVATAWALTKVLLPVRIPLSVWATPWFARTFIIPPVGRVRSFLFKRSHTVNSSTKSVVAPQSGAAGTGATSAGVLPPSSKPKS